MTVHAGSWCRTDVQPLQRFQKPADWGPLSRQGGQADSRSSVPDWQFATRVINPIPDRRRNAAAWTKAFNAIPAGLAVRTEWASGRLFRGGQFDFDQRARSRQANLERRARGPVGLVRGAEALAPFGVQAGKIDLAALGGITHQKDMGSHHIAKAQALLGQHALQLGEDIVGLLYGV